jgi:Tripartite tricarboxylate transporter family receptor
VNQPEHTNSRALRPRVKGRLIAAATTSTGHPARSGMWAIATRSPLRLVVARAMASRSQSRTNAGEAPGKPRLGFDFGQQGGELVELDDRATHASPPSSSTCATARGCVTMANCSLPAVVALTVVCECNTLISLDDGTSGKINMAHAGLGSQNHVWGEQFKLMADVDLVGVPYRGQPEALTNLLGGQVQVTFDPLANSIEHVRAGRLRAWL